VIKKVHTIIDSLIGVLLNCAHDNIMSYEPCCKAGPGILKQKKTKLSITAPVFLEAIRSSVIQYLLDFFVNNKSGNSVLFKIQSKIQENCTKQPTNKRRFC
jgi:hypothetical protein